MGDGWELTFADPNGYRSTWSSTARTSDDPVAEPGVPSVQFSNLDGGSNTLLDNLESATEVTIAGIDTTLYSNQAGTLLVAIVPLNDEHTVQVVIENARTGSVSEILSAISSMTETEWASALDAQSSPTTTVVVRLDDNSVESPPGAFATLHSHLSGTQMDSCRRASNSLGNTANARTVAQAGALMTRAP